MEQDRSADQLTGSGLDIAWASDVGRVRETNQDVALAQPRSGILIVSDGMGGGYGGATAARMVVDRLPGLVRNNLHAAGGDSVKHIEGALRDAFVELNHLLREEASRLDGVRRLGATAVLALARGRALHVAHMGDSRAYLLHGKRLNRLTRDHTSVNVLLDRGRITSEQAEHHPLRGRLSCYVGIAGNARPDVCSVKFRRGDRILLCTDGLTSALDDARLRAVLKKADSPAVACGLLIGEAREAGTRDNITVLVAEKLAA